MSVPETAPSVGAPNADGEPPASDGGAVERAPEADAAHDVAEPPAGGAPTTGPVSESGVPASSVDEECAPAAAEFERAVRGDLKACYHEGKKEDPELRGQARIAVQVDFKGKVTSVKVTEKTLPDPVVACMLKAVKKTPLVHADKCPRRSLVLPVEFPTPR